MSKEQTAQIRLECLREAVKLAEKSTEAKDIVKEAKKMERFIMRNLELEKNE